MTTKIFLTGSSSGFAEDKEAAKELRVDKILPALERGDAVILDFGRVSYATQSYIHALIGEPLRRYQETALAKLEFKNCSPQLKSLVELVVDYSLGGFAEEPTSTEPRRRRNHAKVSGSSAPRKLRRKGLKSVV
jgi:hypothetical protein